ncbi:hypothetical protein [Geopseudomonas aromaticivorans]
MSEEKVIELQHATSWDKLESIAQEGLRGFVYFSGVEELTSYYLETIEDEELVPALLQVSLDALDASRLAPDWPGIQEPIMGPVRDHLGESRSFDEDDLYEAWEDTDRSWQASLQLIGTVRYEADIAPEHIRLLTPDGCLVQLRDYLETLSSSIESTSPACP